MNGGGGDVKMIEMKMKVLMILMHLEGEGNTGAKCILAHRTNSRSADCMY
jgi:hypothetical protein